MSGAGGSGRSCGLRQPGFSDSVRFPIAASLTLTLAAVVPSHARAQRDSQVAAEVGTLVARYDSAWNRRDTVAVSRLLAPTYQYFSSRGGVSSRAETMKFLSAPDYVLKQAKRSELSVSLSGPVAVVSSRWQGHGSYRGEAFNDDQRCGQTWLQSARGWQLVSEHCVQIAPVPGEASN
jgi:ketosteroid isomerase-like protein